jgi:type I restriction enzyme R subunit
MIRNEAATRAEFIDPALERAGWGRSGGSLILYEFQITRGRIQVGGQHAAALIADYLLEVRGQRLAIIEAKRYDAHVTEGLAQAKAYAQKMGIRFAYATNGREIYAVDLQTGREGLVDSYPTPDELWEMTFAESSAWRDRFVSVPDERRGGLWQPRYYQDIAINRVLDAIANGDRRILLTLATGTGKTAIAFQIAWKLFQTRWNLSGEPTRRPRILFLADRNILADQAYNAFGAFPEDAMERMKPADVKKAGAVPKNASIFFTIFQTFLTESTGEVNYGQYPRDFFDFIVIDECHRGGASDESTWRAILEYFEPAVQLGLTATPRRDINIDTYEYFGKPVYTYSLKDGIEDGFLTPFRVRQFESTIDEYIYTPDDIVLEGEVEAGRVYSEDDFNRLIFIEERERLRVKLLMDEIGTADKTLVFCANQDHALTIRDMINQYVQPQDSDFCVRVTANDGNRGEEFLRKFQDNDKTIPTILTTSHKLSTGVDALNVRNIVLLRPIKSMIEFKQIIGRGTRLFDGKDYFTVYDFVEAYKHFSDPDWDGEPLDPEKPDDSEKPTPPPRDPETPDTQDDDESDPQRRQRIVIKLRDGKERAIRHMSQTMFMSPDGRPMSAQDFIKELFGTLTMPEFFASEEELRTIWSDPLTRRALLGRLAEAGFATEDLMEVQKLIDAEHSDLFDVLEYVAYAKEPMTRLERALATRPQLQGALGANQIDFIHFVLDRYVETGVEELDDERLPDLIKLKYEGIHEGIEALGGTEQAREVFIDFQRYLYAAG